MREKIDFVNFHTTIFPSEKIIPATFQEEILFQVLTDFVLSIPPASLELHPVFDSMLIKQGGAYKYWNVPRKMIELWCLSHKLPFQNYFEISIRIEITCIDKKGTLIFNFEGKPSIYSYFDFEGDKTELSRIYSISDRNYFDKRIIEFSKDALIKQKCEPVLINMRILEDINSTIYEDEHLYYDYFLFMDRLFKIDKELGDLSRKTEIVKEFYNRKKIDGSIDLVELINKGIGYEEINIERRIPNSVKREVWKRDGGRCSRCGSREKLEFDHIIPYSKGGSNTARNVELLCMNCNRKKSNTI